MAVRSSKWPLINLSASQAILDSRCTPTAPHLPSSLSHTECSYIAKMASEEPMFDPSLKKRKKKTVAFSEDPLGAEADPTQPAPSTIDDTTTNGEAVDMGPKTMHEQMLKQNGGAGPEDAGGEKKEDDDFKAMFGDLKKKKKKKDIPMDLVRRMGAPLGYVSNCAPSLMTTRALLRLPPLPLQPRISISLI